MTAKEWLMRARKLENRIVALVEAKQRAYNRAVSTTARPRDVCVVGGGNSSPDDKNAAYMELCEEIDRQIDELNQMRTEILHVIRDVEDPVLSTLLVEYYINGKTFKQIADILHYTHEHVRKDLHPNAIKAVSNILHNPT